MPKLTKGEHTLRLQIRHDSLEMLDKVDAMILQLDFKLKEAVSLDCYADLSAARLESGAPSSHTRLPGPHEERLLMRAGLVVGSGFLQPSSASVPSCKASGARST